MELCSRDWQQRTDGKPCGRIVHSECGAVIDQWWSKMQSLQASKSQIVKVTNTWHGLLVCVWFYWPNWDSRLKWPQRSDHRFFRTRAPACTVESCFECWNMWLKIIHLLNISGDLFLFLLIKKKKKSNCHFVFVVRIKDLRERERERERERAKRGDHYGLAYITINDQRDAIKYSALRILMIRVEPLNTAPYVY